jgi:transposase-like protein
MTPEVIEEYIKNPYFCPECKCEDIRETGQYYNGSGFIAACACEDCKFEWNEVYEMVTIKPLEEIDET